MVDFNASSERGGGLAAPRVHQQPHGYRYKDGAPVRQHLTSIPDMFGRDLDRLVRHRGQPVWLCGLPPEPDELASCTAGVPPTHRSGERV